MTGATWVIGADRALHMLLPIGAHECVIGVAPGETFCGVMIGAAPREVVHVDSGAGDYARPVSAVDRQCPSCVGWSQHLARPRTARDTEPLVFDAAAAARARHRDLNPDTDKER